jgi:hypothetical protein
LDRDIIIRYRDTGELQRISEHSRCYIPMHYPLDFPRSEEGWHPWIPLADTNMADNANLHARRRVHINSESDDDEQNALRHGSRRCGGRDMRWNYTGIAMATQ